MLQQVSPSPQQQQHQTLSFFTQFNAALSKLYIVKTFNLDHYYNRSKQPKATQTTMQPNTTHATNTQLNTQVEQNFGRFGTIIAMIFAGQYYIWTTLLI